MSGFVGARKSVERGRFGERLYDLVLDAEAMNYLANVLEEHEAHDAGPTWIASQIRGLGAKP